MLPKPSRPEYSTTIPSSGRKIKYNPFTVREEKILVLAAESNDTDEISNAIVNILSNCITSPSDLNVEELALFDIEYLFLKARSKSAGEKISLIVTDPQDESFQVKHEILIDKIGIKKSENHTNIVDIDDNIKLSMKYPDISFFRDGIDMSNISSSLDVICKCVGTIIDGDEVYNRGDMSDGELIEWLESLTTKQFKGISDFFQTMPKLSHSFTIKNTNTGKDFTMELEGLADFF